MPGNDKKALRYAARLTAIYDYCESGEMVRNYNTLNRTDCMEALEKLKGLPEDLELHGLWAQVSQECPGIGHADVAAIATWSIQGAYKYYDMQRREIETVLCLRELFDKAGGDLFAISDRNGVYCWTLSDWLNFRKRVTWYLVLAVEDFRASKVDFNIDDVLQNMGVIKQNYIKEQGTKK